MAMVEIMVVVVTVVVEVSEDLVAKEALGVEVLEVTVEKDERRWRRRWR